MEKLRAWMEVREVLSDEEIIALVMMHWIQGATPGLRFYREAFGEMRREAERRMFEAYVAVPTGVSEYVSEGAVACKSLFTPCNANAAESVLIGRFCN